MTDLPKLHIGCGIRRIGGYVNIDARQTRATDYVCSADNLPYDDESVARIETYHMIEHLSRNETKRAVAEWYRVLTPGGVLVIECPDFDQNVRDYLAGRDVGMQLAYIFGAQRDDDEDDFHRWGYNAERLMALLEVAGFHTVTEQPAQDYHAHEAGCLRVEATK